MNSRLSLKLLGVIALVIGLAMAIVWISIDFFAIASFSALLDEYRVPNKQDVMTMFLDSAHRALVGAGLVALSAAMVLSYVVIRMILGPLHQMFRMTGKIGHGDYSSRLHIDADDEVGELGKAFNAMIDRLQRVERLRKKMVVDVAHELRAPLTNIRGYLEALRDGVVPPSAKGVESLHEETVRLGNLLDALMRLSAADAASLTLERQVIDLDELVTRSLNVFAQQFADKAISPRLQIAAGAGRAMADCEQIAQVMQNLMDNALRYTPHGGTVQISIERASDAIKVVFANTGEAIATQDLPLIFERFYRVEKSRSRESGGAGIGLAIVKELVEAHGGGVGAESSAGENRIWFTIPA
ncbi:MAG: ATP-binding protein [Chloroflexota bacterium]|nr:ATP-binding protein [Chloroflexota bacterium]